MLRLYCECWQWAEMKVGTAFSAVSVSSVLFSDNNNPTDTLTINHTTQTLTKPILSYFVNCLCDSIMIS
ncbi:hypothetical protein P8452_38960 [Trifolium repens]|nr:hypothetical protein P8452_38960 [Trifolium repens]